MELLLAGWAAVAAWLAGCDAEDALAAPLAGRASAWALAPPPDACDAAPCELLAWEPCAVDDALAAELAAVAAPPALAA